MSKLIFFITLIIISNSPLFAQAKVISQSGIPQAVTEEDVGAFLNK